MAPIVTGQVHVPYVYLYAGRVDRQVVDGRDLR